MSAGIGHGVDRYGAVAEQLSNPSVKMNQLIQYAQGTNPLVPSFMALAEIQNRQNAVALQPGQSSPTTVQQDLISKAESLAPMGGMQGMTPQTAPQQAPQGVAGLQAPQGVAALPSGMGQQSFAGGGIIAFADGTNEKGVQDPNATDDGTANNAYLDRSRGLVEGVKNMVGPVFNPRSYDLPYLYQRDIGQPFQKYANKVVEGFKETPEEQAARFRSYSMTPNQTPTVGGQTVLPTRASKATLSTDADAQAGGYYGGKGPTPAEFLAAHPNITNASTDAPTGAGARTGAKATDAAAQLGVKQVDTGSDMFGKYQKLYDEQKAQAAADKEQSKWMRLLEAGLGIMGGTSQYALTNIAQGALPAAKGAASDIATYRKDTADANKELALLNMKQQEIKNDADKTGITQQHYQDWARIETQKNSILSGQRADLHLEGIAQKIYATDMAAEKNKIGGADLTPERENQILINAYRKAQVIGNKPGAMTNLQGNDIKVPSYDPNTRTFS
jgi:hypothetical protein